jgi:hypothetical protein
MPKTWIGWAILIVVIAWIFHDPSHAGTTLSNAVHNAGAFISSATSNL